MSIDAEPTVAPTPVARLKHPRAIRRLHWINFPLLAIMIWSGLRIYWAEDVYALGIGDWQWFAFFPEVVYDKLDLDRHLARGMAFHFSFAWLFVIEEHGAPLRLATPNEYGIKCLKRIGVIRYARERPADYWAERSYDWYAGL